MKIVMRYTNYTDNKNASNPTVKTPGIKTQSTEYTTEVDK